MANSREERLRLRAIPHLTAGTAALDVRHALLPCSCRNEPGRFSIARKPPDPGSHDLRLERRQKIRSLEFHDPEVGIELHLTRDISVSVLFGDRCRAGATHPCDAAFAIADLGQD